MTNEERKVKEVLQGAEEAAEVLRGPRVKLDYEKIHVAALKGIEDEINRQCELATGGARNALLNSDDFTTLAVVIAGELFYQGMKAREETFGDGQTQEAQMIRLVEGRKMLRGLGFIVAQVITGEIDRRMEDMLQERKRK